jgi:hypothetical protein
MLPQLIHIHTNHTLINYNKITSNAICNAPTHDHSECTDLFALSSNLLQNGFDHVIRLDNYGTETEVFAKLYCCGMTKWKKVAFLGLDCMVSFPWFVVDYSMKGTNIKTFIAFCR